MASKCETPAASDGGRKDVVFFPNEHGEITKNHHRHQGVDVGDSTWIRLGDAAIDALAKLADDNLAARQEAYLERRHGLSPGVARAVAPHAFGGGRRR